MLQMIKRLINFIRLHYLVILFIVSISIFLVISSINIYRNIENQTYKNYKSTTLESSLTCDLMINNQLGTIQVSNIVNDDESLISNIDEVSEKPIKNLDVDTMNPHSKSNLSVDELNKMLMNTGLEFQGQAFYDMENTYNVNALFAMGVAMHESANGYQKANTNNYFGFRGNNGWMSFNSSYDCIQYFGKLIHEYYPNRYTIYDIQRKYCPDGSPWGDLVKQHMRELKTKI